MKRHSKTGRPIIEVQSTQTDQIIDRITIIILVTHGLLIATMFLKLPEVIPIHFNAEGAVDGYGSKHWLWLELLIAIGLYFLLKTLMKFPHQFNYITEITDLNAARQYRSGIAVMRYMNFFIQVLMLFIFIATLSVSMTGKSLLGSWFVWIALVVSLVLPILIAWKMSSK